MTKQKEPNKELTDLQVRLDKELRNEVEYLYAGFESRIPGISIDSIQLKRRFDGQFLAVTRATKDRGRASSTRVVAFTNGESIGDVIGLVEYGLTYNLLSWQTDKYAEKRTGSSNDDGDDQPLTKIKLKK